jgi:hypothetical protein
MIVAMTGETVAMTVETVEIHGKTVDKKRGWRAVTSGIVNRKGARRGAPTMAPVIDA